MIDYVEYASYLAVPAYAVSGAIIGINRKFDILGITLIAIINTISGGVIRDVLANEVPRLLSEPLYIYIAILSVMLTLALKLYRFNLSVDGKIYIFCDAVGLSSYSIIGALVAINQDLNLISTLSFALITAIGGSLARDILLNKVPLVFKTDFYASISLILGFVLFILKNFLLLNSVNITILLFFGIVLRLVAYWRNWSLPIVNI
ncbi:MAG: TRIC cation channel family protein [Rickettsiales bacterium]